MKTKAKQLMLERRLRYLSGVDESLLDRVPEDRVRYVSIGAAVLGTSIVATISMFYAISATWNYGWLPALVVAPLWGLIILNFDRWLVSSPVDRRVSRRFVTMLPRIVLAIFLGLVIAEPLLLGIFNSAIQADVTENREVELTELQSRLIRCNPAPGAPQQEVLVSTGSDCVSSRLAVGSAAGPQAIELTQLQTQALALRSSIDADSQKAADLADLARRECSGDKGPGLTGVPGVAGECVRLRDEADTFAANANLGARTSELNEINQRVASLSGAVSQQGADYLSQRNVLIDGQLNAIRSQQTSIGLLERFEAFGRLVNTNGYVSVVSAFVRIFFVLVDCFPVLVKLLSPQSTYDQMADERRNSRLMRFAKQEEVENERAKSKADSILGEILKDQKDRTGREEVEERARDVASSVALRDQLDELTDKYLTEEMARSENGGPAPVSREPLSGLQSTSNGKKVDSSAVVD